MQKMLESDQAIKLEGRRNDAYFISRPQSLLSEAQALRAGGRQERKHSFIYLGIL